MANSWWVRYVYLRSRSWFWRLPCYFGKHAWSSWEIRTVDRRWIRVCCSCLKLDSGNYLDPDEGLFDGDDEDDN